MIALSESRYSEAVRYNLSALKIDPQNATAYHHIGVAYLNSGRPQEAMPFIVKALSIAPDEKVMLTMATAYDRMGEKTKAAQYYREYLKASKVSDPARQQSLERLSDIAQPSGG
jgi:Tfp pilus assembly protein PilF